MKNKHLSNKPTITVALIVKNEAANLDDCLESVHQWVDEIIIVDSGSSDDTKLVATKYTDKFYEHTNWQGFGVQRQIAQQYASSDFILWLDADERITPELQASIKKAIYANKANTVYTICRLSFVFGRYIRHCGWYPDRVIRLYPTKLTQYNDALVHEKVKLTEQMQVESLAGDAIHYTYNDLHHYLVKSARYAKAWADERQKQGKTSSLTKGIVHALACFLKMYVLKVGFLDGKQGFLLSILSAHSTFAKYADLWIKTKTLRSKD